MREDLVSSAVSFLSDPKVSSSPLAKKVSFLESKGMTTEEIEEALARVNGKSTGNGAIAGSTTAPAGTLNSGLGHLQQPQAVGGGMVVAPPVPQRPSYDWRDIFVAAVLAGGISYGMWTLAKKLLGPWFQVPTQKDLDEDKAKLDAQFQAVEDSLKELKQQTTDTLDTVASQSKKVDSSLQELETILKNLKLGDAERDVEFKGLKTDVEALKDLIPKLMDMNKEAQATILGELQNEVNSLKSLLMSRRPTTPSAPEQRNGADSPGSSIAPSHAASTSVTGLSTRLSNALNNTNNSPAGIPAWQLASVNKDAAGTSSSSQSSSSS
ncbi:peroxisomal membrane anchor protein conserved region-domain-containing protein [Dichotomocladium elegans]|nr:peroxisomal membrane anchor protein conserved region-domain-containing protein [Dichotomocladium elegans]